MLYGILVVLVVAVISVALSIQGWRGRIPAFDLITYHYGIRDFLETGTLLQHGDTGSYGSYKPPGTSWLMLPGILLLDDPRLTDYVGTALLHVFTLLGLYLLARHFFGPATAILTVILYGLSAHGLFLAGSLWPNGRPDFYVWVVFFAVLWVTRRDARYLAVSLAILGLGLYVDMALLPVLVLFPVLWFFYRPPIKLFPLLISTTILVLVWMPYLRFEWTRSFVDVRSQVFQQYIRHKDFKTAWCDPSLILQSWAGSTQVSQGVQALPLNDPDPFAMLLNKLVGYGEMLVSNFQPAAPIPGAALFLLVLTIGGLLLVSVTGDSEEPSARPHFWRDRVSLTAYGALLGGLLIGISILTFNLLGLGDFLHGTKLILLNKVQKALIFSGLTLLGVYWVVIFTDRILIHRHIKIQPVVKTKEIHVLVLSLLVPWIVLLMFAEPGKPERFMWLWTLQSLFLAAFVTYILPRFVPSGFWTVASQLLVIILIAGNYMMGDRVGSWITTGWSGEDAAEVQVVDAIAAQMQSQGRNEAAIGYRMFIYPFMAEYNSTNPLYKVGAELDLMLRFRHGIRNLNQCAEGVSAQDDYRIVETKPKPPEWAPQEFFSVEINNGFELIEQFGTYQIYKRAESRSQELEN